MIFQRHQKALLWSKGLNSVLLAGRQWPNIEYLLGGFVNFQGIQSSITKEPYSFAIFQGWEQGCVCVSGPPVPPSGFELNDGSCILSGSRTST